MIMTRTITLAALAACLFATATPAMAWPDDYWGGHAYGFGIGFGSDPYNDSYAYAGSSGCTCSSPRVAYRSWGATPYAYEAGYGDAYAYAPGYTNYSYGD